MRQWTGVRVTFNAVILCKGPLRDPVFLCSLLIAYTNCANNSHVPFLLLSSDP